PESTVISHTRSDAIMDQLTVVWKDTDTETMQLNSSNRLSFTTAGPSWAPARPKITSVSCAWEIPTIWSVPTATVIAQEANVYSRASAITEARSEEHTSELQSRFDIVCRYWRDRKN